MIRSSLIISAALAGIIALPAMAQTIVRETVPTTNNQVIVANSEADLALQEEIRKIRAYNAYVDQQVGISETYTDISAPIVPLQPVAKEAAPKAPADFAGRSVEIFAQSPSTNITYATTNGKLVSITPTTTIMNKRVEGIPTFSQYTVMQGDTLYSLARKNCVSVSDIQAKNALTDNAIQIGQILNMPANKCGEANIVQTTSKIISQPDTVRRVLPVPVTVKVDNNRKYAVLPKDTLYSIGKRYCLSADELAAFNGFDVSTAIHPGQYLSLPNKACEK